MKTLRSALVICCSIACLTAASSYAQVNYGAQQPQPLTRVVPLNNPNQGNIPQGMQMGAPVDNSYSAPAVDPNLPPGSPAALEVRLSAIEDQLRDLRGKYEESENHAQKLQEALDKFQHDTEFRFNDMSNAIQSASKASSKPDDKQPSGSATKSSGKNDDGTGSSGGEGKSQGETHSKDNGKTDSSDDASNFSSPREHYNYAFRLLNQTQYQQAADTFESFTKKYPKDPLVGNAFYWEGETYYIRRDYVKAADYFRQGFEALPQGPKAADNLLKLAMSLNAMNRDKEACLVLSQIKSKFKKSAISAVNKAEAEEKRLGCHSTTAN